ncbi:MAG: hypothetical protein ACK4FK_16595 [Ferrovibrio sp.]|uniref:hypothetical protein n=1 Tax=Ferrovibrio sp. TaxID=1917215 RepID=UPI00391BDF6C
MGDVPNRFWHIFGTLKIKNTQQEPGGLNDKIALFQLIDCWAVLMECAENGFPLGS